MEILKNLEENAANVRDPTGYVVTAAQKRLASAARGVSEEDQRLRKRIGWLNRNVTFNAELRYDQASQALHGLSATKQMEILKALEENFASIPDPTAYVVAAATEALANGGGAQDSYIGYDDGTDYGADEATEDVSAAQYAQAWANAQQGVAGAIADLGQQAAMPQSSDLTDRIRKRVYWMNTNVALSSPLDFNRLAPELLRLDITQAMAVLKKLEDGASTILDPNTYVTTAVESLLATSNPAPQGEQQALDDALRKRISWMNANVPLAVPLNYDQLQSALLALGDRAKAMEVLKKLESNALDVQDPNEYVGNMATAYLAV